LTALLTHSPLPEPPGSPTSPLPLGVVSHTAHRVHARFSCFCEPREDNARKLAKARKHQQSLLAQSEAEIELLSRRLEAMEDEIGAEMQVYIYIYLCIYIFFHPCIYIFLLGVEEQLALV